MENAVFSLAIRCPGCGREGVANWRERRNGKAKVSCDLESISTGFRHKGRDTASGDSRIVCDGCGAVVPG